MQYKTEENGIINCTMEGELTLNTISAVKEFFVARLHEAKGLHISHAADVQVDIAYLQLLLSLVKSAQNAGKTCGIVERESPELDKLFITCGCNEGKENFYVLNEKL
ncbi:MAG: STAS domain-containing protein [Ignavibacteriales bacterium]|nr:STAS domain-containing protein [Ignavibacteriales bacterium]